MEDCKLLLVSGFSSRFDIFTFQRCESAPIAHQFLHVLHALATAWGTAVNINMRSKISRGIVLQSIVVEINARVPPELGV